ncbi:alpha/beta hydrolase [Cryobacterium luteum]|uniref:DUF1023 domain-containing protein n=1 Tax=Cryobacterium luteum TaxID=1424661 RepID=A0A1H8HU63_9MICO|nr:alpha/beta hydrolase [Cryobacterium luteum]TFB94190.1 hypothetical protein E3O10_01715 [Cryobacterium luteum]SEN59535.1 Alpha/beta hydrolase [Cryobacterium luteum]
MSERPDAVPEGELTISVGGTTLVATDAVLAQAEMLRNAQVQAGDWQSRVESIRQLDLGGVWTWTPEDPSLTLTWAGVALGQLEERTGDLAASLTDAAERYGWTERAVMHMAVLGSAGLGYDLGRFRALVFLLAAGPAARGALAWRAWNSHHGSPGIDYRFLTSPAAVVLTKLIVTSLDDVAAGALGVPLPIDLLLGDSGLGLVGVSTTAVAVLAAARSRGLFREGPVKVATAGAATSATPPTGVGDLAARIPKAIAGQPQVLIENYGTPENLSWAVYVGGTIDWNAVATTEPWDLTANVTAMAGQNAGSLQAVMQAMHAAGITAGDPVVIAGHSQGGLVATQVAASGAFAVRAVVTFGAPESRVSVPSGVATMTVEHTDDVTTGLGGASMVQSEDRITVRREAFFSAEPPAGEALPAHHLDTYRETALLIDASPEKNLTDFRDTVTGVLGSEPGDAVLWRGIRLPERPTPR